MKKIFLLLVFVLSSTVVFGYYDHATNVHQSGTLVQLGDLRITIFEQASGGLGDSP